MAVETIDSCLKGLSTFLLALAVVFGGIWFFTKNEYRKHILELWDKFLFIVGGLLALLAYFTGEVVSTRQEERFKTATNELAHAESELNTRIAEVDPLNL